MTRTIQPISLSGRRVVVSTDHLKVIMLKYRILPIPRGASHRDVPQPRILRTGTEPRGPLRRRGCPGVPIRGSLLDELPLDPQEHPQPSPDDFGELDPEDH